MNVGITGDFREMGKEMDGWMRTECETRREKRRGEEVKEEKEWRGWGGMDSTVLMKSGTSSLFFVPLEM